MFNYCSSYGSDITTCCMSSGNPTEDLKRYVRYHFYHSCFYKTKIFMALWAYLLGKVLVAMQKLADVSPRRH